MSQESFSDTALVVLGHGSTRNEESAATVYQHAAELRRRKIFGEVREAFWKQDPNVRDVLTSMSAPRVFIAPLFISEGYFSGRIIPGELGFGRECAPIRRALPAQTGAAGPGNVGSSTWYYCRPVGTHAGMTGVLLDRARGVVAQFPFPRAPRAADTTLFIAGHGTSREENSRESIDRQVELLRGLGEYASVHGVFLEEEPRIGAAYLLAQTRSMVVVPFFISDGMHTREDIPLLMGESRRSVQQRLANGRPTWHNPTERNGKLVWYTSAAGTDPLMAEIILDRVREAAGLSA